MRWTGVLATLLALALVAGNAMAYNLAEWQYGNPVRSLDGRALAMGGAGLASSDGARGMRLNPALLGKASRIEVAVGALAVAAEESREVPLHDSFDGIIAYNTYAMNIGLYDHYSVAAAFNMAEISALHDWAPTVGIGYGPRLDMNYEYHVQFRNNDTQAQPTDRVIADYYADASGGVSAFTIALAQEVAPEVFVGVGVDLLYGDWNAETRWVFPPNSDDEDEDSKTSYDGGSGAQFTLGVLVERLHRVDLALVYRSPFTMKGNYRSRELGAAEAVEGDFEYEYPYSLGFGLEYHPRNEIMTTVSLDIEYTRWSELDEYRTRDIGAGEDPVVIEIDDPDLDDTVVYRAGVEHAFFDDTFARFGFMYQPSYVHNSDTRAAFSVGLGVDILDVRVDIGGQVGLREYYIDEGGRVRETTTQLVATAFHTF